MIQEGEQLTVNVLIIIHGANSHAKDHWTEILEF